MHANEAWIALFRKIPVDLHDSLALGMTTGAEIVVQKIVTLDTDFMIIRGRLAGTQDSGRIVMIPYPQLTFVAIQRDLKDTDVENIFGKTPPAPVVVQASPSAEAAPPPAPVVVAEMSASKGPGASTAKKAEKGSKAILIAKLRDRLKEAGK